MASLCHLWFTTTNLSYRFPIFETSATALCGTTGNLKQLSQVLLYICTWIHTHQQYFLKAIVPALDPPLLQRNPLLGSQRAVQWRVDRGTNARGKSLGVPIPAEAGRDEPKFNGSAIVRVPWGLVWLININQFYVWRFYKQTFKIQL